MNEHITIGRKFPEIKLNTSCSFGIDESDFNLAFEIDVLLRLIASLDSNLINGNSTRNTSEFEVPCCLNNSIAEVSEER
jgi:chlorite dismutase